jgi:hypothetical protein
MNFGRWLLIGVVFAAQILLVELSAQASAAVQLTDEEAAWVKAHYPAGGTKRRPQCCHRPDLLLDGNTETGGRW